MLGFTAAESTRSRSARAVKRSDHTEALHPLQVVVDGGPDVRVLRSAGGRPERAPQEQRRAIGIFSVILAIALDASAVLLWLRIAVPDLSGKGPKFFSALYVVVALALLVPTYRRGRLVPRPAEQLVTIATRLALAPIITAILTLTRDDPLLGTLDMWLYTGLVGATIATVMLFRILMFKMVHAIRARGYDLEDTLIVGAGPVGVQVAEALESNREFGLAPFGFLDRFDEEPPYPIVGRPEQLISVLEETGIRHVVLAFGAASEEELVGYVRRCSLLPVQFYAVPRFFELGVPNDQIAREVDGFALVPLRRPGHGHQMWPAKRAFDVVVSSFLLLLTSPVMAACALAVRLSSRGPILFKQLRVGRDGRPFEILKFRSMRVNDDSNTRWSVDDDDRVTRVGRFLRKSHLDELPQIINVLKGEMSIVGPRPERPYFVEQFTDEIDGYAERHRVPAGITGWAQVNGFWGDTSIEARVRLDNRYIENWSLWRDLVIALRTIPTLLGKRR
jgi:exopolysaccharide biosynthesis polyprenyl glycosylphosphotransferase